MTGAAPMVMGLVLRDGRLVGGARVQVLEGVEGARFWLVLTDEDAARLDEIPDVAGDAELRELLGGWPGLRWGEQAPPGPIRWKGSWVVELDGGGSIVVVGDDRLPSWLAELVRGGDPETVARMAAAATTRLAPGRILSSPRIRSAQRAERVAPAGTEGERGPSGAPEPAARSEGLPEDLQGGEPVAGEGAEETESARGSAALSAWVRGNRVAAAGIGIVVLALLLLGAHRLFVEPKAEEEPAESTPDPVVEPAAAPDSPCDLLGDLDPRGAALLCRRLESLRDDPEESTQLAEYFALVDEAVATLLEARSAADPEPTASLAELAEPLLSAAMARLVSTRYLHDWNGAKKDAAQPVRAGTETLGRTPEEWKEGFAAKLGADEEWAALWAADEEATDDDSAAADEPEQPDIDMLRRELFGADDNKGRVRSHEALMSEALESIRPGDASGE